MPIKLLDSRVISRIAAGEVVERPSSVVKELLENALDAGASQISVEVAAGGTGLVRVTDNGSGIPQGEVELAFERHATSKLSGIDDLESIATLGFRGEALPSIASVAEIEIVTRALGDLTGSRLILKDGEVISRDSLGRSPGTAITVKNLFRDVPARLKFLRSTATENSRIAGVVSQYALAFPGVKFTLQIDGRTSLRTSGSGRLTDSVVQVYGAEVARNMLEIGAGDAEWQGGMSSAPEITGLAGSPSLSRSSRGYLSFFVNRRWVNSRSLSWAVEEAYHGLLMTGKHPVAVINISLPYGEVDVNIHPAKTEVKFRDERAVFITVQKAVRRALIRQSPVPKIEEVSTAYASPPSQGQLPWKKTENGASASPQSDYSTPAASLPALRVLGQIMQSYIVAEGPDGLYLIDQHAAHERVVFEQVMGQRLRHEAEVQGLLEPVLVDLTPAQEEALKNGLENLAEFGFAIEPFGERSCLVRSVPAVLYGRDWMEMLRESLDALTDENRSRWAENIAVSIACHSAVRAGQILTDSEMRELVKRLETAGIPHTCPHGRPATIHLSSERMRREFGRA